MNLNSLSPLFVSPQGLSSYLTSRKNAYQASGSFSGIADKTRSDLDVSLEDFFTPRPAMQVDRDGIATICVTGLLSRGGPAVDSKLWGDTDYALVEKEIGDALQNGAVCGIELYVNSPGGSACGCKEVAAVVAEAATQKPVIAWTNGIAASAAYYIAAAANFIYTTPSAVLGCIGTVMNLYDFSRMFQEAGIDVLQFASGPLKGLGSEGVPLTDAQKTFLQDFIDQCAGQFKSDMLAYRGGRGLTEDSMDGGWCLGSRSKELGFSDAICDESFAKRDILALVGIRK